MNSFKYQNIRKKNPDENHRCCENVKNGRVTDGGTGCYKINAVCLWNVMKKNVQVKRKGKNKKILACWCQ